jgi:hypothetical protein
LESTARYRVGPPDGRFARLRRGPAANLVAPGAWMGGDIVEKGLFGQRHETILSALWNEYVINLYSDFCFVKKALRYF